MDTLTASRYKKATRYVATVKSWRFATVLSFEFLNPKPTIERKPLETRESPGRPREKSAQYRKVNLTLHLSVRYRTSELLWDRSCGLRRLNTGAIRRGAEHVWSQQSQILSTRFWYAGLSPFRYGRRLNLANFSHRRGSA